MATFNRFEDIDGWKNARKLTRSMYEASNKGGFAKDYDLRNQIRRSCVSIMSNIADGFERDGTKEFIHFLSIAKASAGEVRSQIYVAFVKIYYKRNFRWIL